MASVSTRKFGSELTPKQVAGHLACFAFVERNLTRLLGGWLPIVPDWDFKIEMSRHLYEDALHADALARRVREMGTSIERLGIPDERLVKLFDTMDGNSGPFGLLAAIYDVVKPKLIESYQWLKDSVCESCDHPSVLLMERFIQEEQAQVDWAQARLSEILNTHEKRASARGGREAVEWQMQGWDFTTLQMQRGEPLPPSPVKTPAPPDAARDERFTLVEPDDPRRPQGDPFGDGEDLLAWLHKNANNELNAAELCGRNIYENPQMPWEFAIDMARQAWDEARHAEICAKALEAKGGYMGMFPLCSDNYRYRIKLDLIHRMADLNRVFERKGMPMLVQFIKHYEKNGDEVSAHIYRYMLADEVPHVNIGTRWLRWIFGGDMKKVARAEWEAVQARKEYAERTGLPAHPIVDTKKWVEPHYETEPKSIEDWEEEAAKQELL